MKARSKKILAAIVGVGSAGILAAHVAPAIEMQRELQAAANISHLTTSENKKVDAYLQQHPQEAAPMQKSIQQCKSISKSNRRMMIWNGSFRWRIAAAYGVLANYPDSCADLQRTGIAMDKGFVETFPMTAVTNPVSLAKMDNAQATLEREKAACLAQRSLFAKAVDFKRDFFDIEPPAYTPCMKNADKRFATAMRLAK